ncbi:MAG: amidohydrolase [Actinobacteria bacterium]|uniref:Unannotated protein n=1 Tax=freshwater metagenome TaxID=449393 RepID=A0A6J6WE39_9ZZZZ|nr:amidohydrolase [Actinomycetota bacterium]
MSLHDQIRSSVSAVEAELLALSHDIHAHPEIGYEEFHAAEVTTALLARHGFLVERPIAGLETAFRATKGSGGLRISLCAEYDALPDVGHACGHNIIAASSLGAAVALGEIPDQIDATIVVFGTPSEEGGGGKVDIINAGLFDDIHLSMMVHPWPTERLEAQCLAVVGFELTFFGKEAHASAAPWEGRNTVDALTLAQVAIGLLRQQLRPGDQVHHMVKTGGSFANIIPAKSVAQFMCRSINIERLNELRVRVDKCFQAATLATDTSYEIEVLGHEFTHMISDGDILKHYRNNAERFGRTFELDDEGVARPTISTDMANVSLVTPSIHPLIKIETNGAINHQPEFTASCITPSADQAVLEGAMIMAMTAIDTALDGPLRTRLLERTAR